MSSYNKRDPSPTQPNIHYSETNQPESFTQTNRSHDKQQGHSREDQQTDFKSNGHSSMTKNIKITRSLSPSGGDIDTREDMRKVTNNGSSTAVHKRDRSPPRKRPSILPVRRGRSSSREGLYRDNRPPPPPPRYWREISYSRSPSPLYMRRRSDSRDSFGRYRRSRSPLSPRRYRYRSPSPLYRHRSPSSHYRCYSRSPSPLYHRYNSRSPSLRYRCRSSSPRQYRSFSRSPLPLCRLLSRSPPPRRRRDDGDGDDDEVYWRPHNRSVSKDKKSIKAEPGNNHDSSSKPKPIINEKVSPSISSVELTAQTAIAIEKPTTTDSKERTSSVDFTITINNLAIKKMKSDSTSTNHIKNNSTTKPSYNSKTVAAEKNNSIIAPIKSSQPPTTTKKDIERKDRDSRLEKDKKEKERLGYEKEETERDKRVKARFELEKQVELLKEKEKLAKEEKNRLGYEKDKTEKGKKAKARLEVSKREKEKLEQQQKEKDKLLKEKKDKVRNRLIREKERLRERDDIVMEVVSPTPSALPLITNYAKEEPMYGVDYQVQTIQEEEMMDVDRILQAPTRMDVDQATSKTIAGQALLLMNNEMVLPPPSTTALSLQNGPINTNKKKTRLPLPWKVILTDDGDIFYVNPKTGEQRSTRPDK